MSGSCAIASNALLEGRILAVTFPLGLDTLAACVAVALLSIAAITEQLLLMEYSGTMDVKLSI